VIAVLAMLGAISRASGAELGAYKDELFAYPGIIGSAGNILDLTIDYNELRDVNERDEVPERRVKRDYISLKPRKFEKDIGIDSELGTLRTIATGTHEGARFIVVYLHGQGGNRKQGSNDYTFGGNFNRIKNLAALNGGLYLTPDFSGFGDKGSAQVKSIITAFLAKSPEAKLVIACGSMGGFLSHRLANDKELSASLSGMLFLGSFPDDQFQASLAFKAGMPVFIGHGTNDSTSPIAGMEAFAANLGKSGKGRVMLHRFQSGSHGTPVRMSDWRLVLNWMLAQ
jgi:pimeloyl-ACP methyl ester carboxylesterase